MTDQVWYYAVGGNRQGPVSDADLRGRIESGEIRPDTLVWNAGMTDWAKAGDVPGLMLAGVRASLPPALADGGQQGLPLEPMFGTWALLGRSLLVVIGQLLIIPSPWTMTSFYRWFIDHIEVPNGKHVTFAGRPGDIWYVFILNALFGYAGFEHQALPLLLLPLNALFSLMIIRWVVTSLRWDGQSAPLGFVGSYWGLLGWMALFWVSFLSIIGWAWVATATSRWICRHIEGSREQLSFVASGWGLLWRSVVFVVAFVFIIPIPWALAWYTRWTISQFHLTARA